MFSGATDCTSQLCDAAYSCPRWHQNNGLLNTSLSSVSNLSETNMLINCAHRTGCQLRCYVTKRLLCDNHFNILSLPLQRLHVTDTVITVYWAHYRSQKISDQPLNMLLIRKYTTSMQHKIKIMHAIHHIQTVCVFYK